MGSGFAKRKKEAQQFQQKLAHMQEQMQQESATGSSGAGLVKITLNGAHAMTSIKIQPECVDPEDIEALEDLIADAYRDALAQLEKTREFSQGLPNLGNLNF